MSSIVLLSSDLFLPTLGCGGKKTAAIALRIVIQGNQFIRCNENWTEERNKGSISVSLTSAVHPAASIRLVSGSGKREKVFIIIKVISITNLGMPI